ncbi:MAG: AMP-binding protein, partial [Rhizobacter sp.]
MQKPWLKSYPPGVPAEVDITAYGSLVDLLEESFQKYADRPAADSMDKTITYREIDEGSKALAAWLQSKGLVPGARVAIMMPNVLQYMIAIAAILRAGMVVVNVNPLYTARELEHQLKDSGAEAIIVLENFAATLEQVVTRTNVRHVVLASMGEMLGAKGLLVNFVVRNVRKMVPPYRLPVGDGRTVTKFNAAVSAGRGLTLKRPSLSADSV